MAMRQDERRKRESRTYCRRDPGYSGDKKPNDALVGEDHISHEIASSEKLPKTSGTAPVSKVVALNQTCLHDDGADGTGQGA